MNRVSATNGAVHRALLRDVGYAEGRHSRWRAEVRCAVATRDLGPRGRLRESAHDPIQAPVVGKPLPLVLARVLEDEAGTRDEVLHPRGDEHFVSSWERCNRSTDGCGRRNIVPALVLFGRLRAASAPYTHIEISPPSGADRLGERAFDTAGLPAFHGTVWVIVGRHAKGPRARNGGLASGGGER